MPFAHEASEHPLDPLGALEHWLIALFLHLLLGLTLGALAAQLMRKQHLHWSWATVAFVPTILMWRSLGAMALPLLVATITTTRRARRWHREDLDAGVDMAEIAALRSTPLDAMRALMRAAALRYGWSVAGKASPDGKLQLGRDERGRAVLIPFAGSSGGRHVLVVGATGSGKTVTQTYLAKQAIELGMGAIVIDPKGDGGMREQLRLATTAAGRAFLEWTPTGQCVYNPFAAGGETEIADKALAGESFTEPHYLRQAQRYLGHAVRALRSSGAEVSLRGIVELLDPERLEDVARGLCDTDAERTYLYLDSLSARQRSDLAGARDRLAILVESDVGRWLDPRTSGAERLQLPEAVRARSTVYFSLQSDSRPLLAQMLGAAIVQDLQTTVAALQGDPIPTMVVIDEFSAISTEHVVRLFGRARSAGFSLLLGTQELSDLRPPGHERLLEQVMGNLSVLVAHRQVVPSSAALIAEVTGTAGAWRVSRHSNGNATHTRVRETALNPSRIMGLGQGCAAVIVPGAENGARITRIGAR